MDTTTIIQGALVLATVGGIAYGMLKDRRLKAVVRAVTEFGDVAKVYYSLGPDGWTDAEKQQLADATIDLFEAVEEAGIELASREGGA